MATPRCRNKSIDQPMEEDDDDDDDDDVIRDLIFNKTLSIVYNNFFKSSA